jgi:transglutaminase-like putative cysteine protease
VIYDVRQATTYTYASKVGYAHHVLRLTPVDRPRQRVQATALNIEPVPAGRREGRDFFGNRLTWIEIDEPHDELIIRVAGRVAVESPGGPAPLDTPSWEAVRGDAFVTSEIGPTSPAHFLFPSRQVALDPQICTYAHESFPPGRPILDGALELMGRVKADFAYEIGATTASTTPSMAFTLRRGVCQDFAHVMISGMRGLGLPAAYVSGYLHARQKSGEPNLQGAGAMHAWVLVWCGAQAGWIGLDPTNAMIAGEDHVVVAIGRDYADVAPIDGVIFASGGQRLGVSVSVTPLAAA